MHARQGITSPVGRSIQSLGPKSIMNREPPVGLPIWLLAVPPLALAASIASLVFTHQGLNTSPFAGVAFLIGWLGAMVAIVLSIVLVPVGIYSLTKNPALRTAPQLILIGLGALIAMLPFLAMFGGGI
jgi:hypothetical protein